MTPPLARAGRPADLRARAGHALVPAADSVHQGYPAERRGAGAEQQRAYARQGVLVHEV